MAVAYHTVLLPDIHQGMLEGIRKTYDGPLTHIVTHISEGHDGAGAGQSESKLME
jgi:hypothetical protein